MWVSPMPEDVLDCFQLVQKPCTTSKNFYKDILIMRTGYVCSREDKVFIEKLHDAVRMVSALAGR